MRNLRHNPREMSVKDAERHAKILAKIEKYKEDKIQKELAIIEKEKLKTEKMIRIKRRKEEKHRQYLEGQRARYPYFVLFDVFRLVEYHKAKRAEREEKEK